MTIDPDKLNESEISREVSIEDSKIYIDADVDQVMDVETFMNVFSDKLQRRQQLRRQIRDVQNRIEDLLEEHEDIEDDLVDLGRAAEQVVEEYDYEMPELWVQKVRDEVMGDDEK